MKTDSIGIIVAAHYECGMPDDPIYIPVMAGAALRDSLPAGFTADDTGDNISSRNPGYSELTALYWGWKHLDRDIIGLCHYRRFFASPNNKSKLLNGEEAKHLLNYYDVILPAERNYLIETNYSHYANSHNAAYLDVTRKIISQRHPDFLESYDRRMSMSKGHRFNMFLMRKSVANEYCEWIFDILFELEKTLGSSSYEEKNSRLFGFIAERLLDVWIDAKGLRHTDLSYIFAGNERLLRKGTAMTVRKIRAMLRHRMQLRNE